MRREDPTIFILRKLREKNIDENSILSKKAIFRFLNVILKEVGIYSQASLYQYFNKLKLEGAIIELEDGNYRINFSKFGFTKEKK